MNDDYRQLIGRIRLALSDGARMSALSRAVKRGRDARKAQFSRMENPSAFVSDIRTLKTGAVAHMDDLVRTFSERAADRT